MRASRHPLPSLLLLLVAAALSTPPAHAQGVNVTFRVDVQSPRPTQAKEQHHDMSMPGDAADPVVAWLTPAAPAEPSAQRPPAPSHTFVLTQKNKQFSPHLLVIPTGSRVEFPNLDPFFHNVFSLFNGRRFDLGLYEAGSRRSVRFDNDGVSYIFCNIHPEMGAVIVSVSTPFHATSDRDHSIAIRNVPPGEYVLHLWSENVPPSALAAATQRLQVSAQDLHLPPIALQRAPSSPQQHLNKFGDEYKRPDQTPY